MQTQGSFTRRSLFAAAASLTASAQASAVKRYVRFRKANRIAYGLLAGEQVRELSGDFLAAHKETGAVHALKDVKLLAPVVPGKVLALARNYQSHLGRVEPPTSSLIGPDDAILIPPDATDVHYEGELVIVIGKRLRRVDKQQAAAGIFGVACGNDVSERQWQNSATKDIQWWRAKGSDTFSPLGPCVATGLNYGKLQLKTRLNGKVVQEQPTSDLIYDCPTMVSFASQYVTLEPGDLVYTGTPGTTKKMSPGDVVEVEIEGIGTLRNPVRLG
jgi:2-keto-4-pentenoate hydratase/2-oxohepta-3-ene-1,7-dioic acid hydratase in catechol pathway